MTLSPSSQEFFEAKYKAQADPWEFASSASELARYDAIVAALNGRRYQHAFEPACSVGVLTVRLAVRCDRVSAFDLSPTAAAAAQVRCSQLPQVEVCCASVAEIVPEADVDLLLLSEIGYYFSTEEWERLLDRLVTSCARHCTVLAAHWLGESQDHRLSGDEVHAVLRACSWLKLEHEERHDSFRLDRFHVVQG